MVEPPLYTQLFPQEKQESLIVSFDNGIDPDPAFSGIVTGRIYLDASHNLCLATWPIASQHSQSWRKEVLLTQVEKYSWQFLGEIQKAHPKILPVTPQWGWHPHWPQERSDRPSWLLFTVYQDKLPLEFTFRLPTALPLITYWERA